MSKKTGKTIPTKQDASADALFVIGLDKNGKPQGARFKTLDDRVVSITLDMGLTSISPASAAFTEVGMKLPPGRIYASGKAFVPNIRRAIYDKLMAILQEPGDGSTGYRLAKPSEDPPEPPEVAQDLASVSCVSPMVAGLPRDWSSVDVGHMVLILESEEDGWWPTIVQKRVGDLLTVRFRDYPEQGEFVRHVSTVALVNPGLA